MLSDSLQQSEAREETRYGSKDVSELEESNSDSYRVIKVEDIDNEDEVSDVFCGLIKSLVTDLGNKEEKPLNQEKSQHIRTKPTQKTTKRICIIPIDPFICLPDTITNEDGIGFKCSVPNCNIRIRSKQFLLEHIGVHGLKYYCCDLCTFTTKYIPNLKLHLRTHPGVKLVRRDCRKCSQIIKQDHFNRKPINCNQCRYIQHNSNTEIIMSTYRCTFCKYRFDNFNEFERHMKSHERVKPTYICNGCHRSYTTVNYLKNHINNKLCPGQQLDECPRRE